MAEKEEKFLKRRNPWVITKYSLFNDAREFGDQTRLTTPFFLQFEFSQEWTLDVPNSSSNVRPGSDYISLYSVLLASCHWLVCALPLRTYYNYTQKHTYSDNKLPYYSVDFKISAWYCPLFFIFYRVRRNFKWFLMLWDAYNFFPG